MRQVLAIFFLLFAHSASALDPVDFVANFAGQSSFERAQAAFDFCDESFKASPALYQTRISAMGDLYARQPEAAYMALSTCQTMWVSKYLDPDRLAQLQKRNRSVVAFLLSGADLLYTHLPEEIRLTLETLPRDTRHPYSPYEILSHMASSERRMNETLNREMRSAATTLLAGTAAVGLTATALKGVKGLSQLTAGASQTAGKLVKQALLVTLVAMGVEAAADSGTWHLRRGELEKDVERWSAKILDPQGAPVPVLLEQYFKSLERLGFFYTYDLYLAESGQAKGEHAVNSACVDQVRAHFTTGAPVQACRDAASAWILGAQFLRDKFPGNREASTVADRLTAKAKRALWRHLEVEAYKRSLPVCRPLPSSIIFKIDYECYDQSGNVII